MVKELMTDQEGIEGTGYWFGKMVSATLLHQQLRSTLGTVQAHQFMVTVSFNTIKDCNQSSFSRCPMKSTTTEKDHSHKWIYKEPNDQEINFLSAWHNTADSQPRTWEAQFQSGIKTIALIAVREGVVQLGAVHKVVEDLSYVVLLRKKFSYIESIPGVLLPHPSSSAHPYKVDGYGTASDTWHYQGSNITPQSPTEFYDHYNQVPFKITPSMSSLEALLSKLPSVVPPPQPAAAHHQAAGYCDSQSHYVSSIQRGMEKVAKEEIDEEYTRADHQHDVGESSSSLSGADYRKQQFQQFQDLNVNVRNTSGYFE